MPVHGKIIERRVMNTAQLQLLEGKLKTSIHIWGASIIETCQRSYIELCEQPNADAHSPQMHIHLEQQGLQKQQEMYMLSDIMPDSETQRYSPPMWNNI